MHDSRWLDVVEDIYTWHHRWERYFRNTESLARAAVIYSQQTAHYYGGGEAREKVEDHTLGAYQALVEARIPFDMVHDRRLDQDNIDRYKVLVLPNIAALSDRQCAQLRGFVERGGSIVATYETSLYDEWGIARADLGLADLFGVTCTGPAEHGIKNSYLRVEHGADDDHPLLAGLESADRIIGGVQRLPVAATAEFASRPLTVVPTYPDLPMEEVYPRIPRTDEPGAYLRAPGAGRVIYFPWDIDRTFWEVLDPDHGRVLANAVTWALAEQPVVTVAGPGLVDIALWRQESSLTLHLVNLTNPMAMRGAFRELLPLGPQLVRIQLPAGTRAERVRLLRAEVAPQIRSGGRELELTVPTVLDHEVVAVDLQSE